MKLLCGKCKTLVEPDEMYVCYDCGAYICDKCRKNTNGYYCPDCNMPLSKLC